MRHGRQDIHANDDDSAPRGVLARLSYARSSPTLALFAAPGGKATAATLARDSVGTPQIKTDAVRSPEIQADAVRSSEIQDESVHLAETAPDTRTALEARVRVATADHCCPRVWLRASRKATVRRPERTKTGSPAHLRADGCFPMRATLCAWQRVAGGAAFRPCG